MRGILGQCTSVKAHNPVPKQKGRAFSTEGWGGFAWTGDLKLLRRDLWAPSGFSLGRKGVRGVLTLLQPWQRGSLADSNLQRRQGSKQQAVWGSTKKKLREGGSCPSSNPGGNVDGPAQTSPCQIKCPEGERKSPNEFSARGKSFFRDYLKRRGKANRRGPARPVVKPKRIKR